MGRERRRLLVKFRGPHNIPPVTIEARDSDIAWYTVDLDTTSSWRSKQEGALQQLSVAWCGFATRGASACRSGHWAPIGAHSPRTWAPESHPR